MEIITNENVIKRKKFTRSYSRIIKDGALCFDYNPLYGDSLNMY